MMESEFFKISEFDCPGLPGSGVNMSKELVSILDNIRKNLQRPIRISSGYRTKEHNESLLKRGYKASKNSEHLRGNAVDIFVNSSSEKWEIVNAAIENSITRIGISSNFIHLDIGDRDGSKPGNVIWTY